MSKILIIDNVTRLPKECGTGDVAEISQIRLTSLDPIIVPVGANMIPHLNAEFIQGLTPTDLRNQVLNEKKIISYKAILNAQNNTGNDTDNLNISDFIITNHTKPDSTTKTASTEGLIIAQGTSYYESIIINTSTKAPYIDSGFQVFGIIEEDLYTYNNVTATWTNGNNVVNYSGPIDPSTLDGYYIKGTNDKYYKITSYVDNGNNTGSFVIDVPYDGADGSLTLTRLKYTIKFYKENVAVGNESLIPDGDSIDIYAPWRLNLENVNENEIHLPIVNYASALANAHYVTESQLNDVKDDPVLVSSAFGTVDAFSNAVDLYNLMSNFTIQGNGASGIVIQLGNSSGIDTVYIPTLKFDYIRNTNDTILNVTFEELNQLSGINSDVTAQNLNSLLAPHSLIDQDGHKHIIKVAYLEGDVGDVVAIDNLNRTVKAIADLTVNNTGKNVVGILIKIDGTYAYVQTYGTVTEYVYSYNNGTEVFLSETNAGKLVTNPPANPNCIVYSIGKIFGSNLFINLDKRWYT